MDYYKYDVIIAKNYLNEKELKDLNRIVTMYLDYAEMQAEKHNAMSNERLGSEIKCIFKI